jgi:hypothetical protein
MLAGFLGLRRWLGHTAVGKRCGCCERKPARARWGVVSSQVLWVGWYRLRATFGRRWGGCLGLLGLIGVGSGVSLG